MSASNAFDRLVGGLDYPMFIVTTAAGGERAGCLVGFAAQCSIHPPRYLLCMSDKNHTYRVLSRGAEAMAVHVVPSDADRLVELFGAETGDDADKFERCEWHAGPGGVPILEACGSWFAGRILERLRLGDHVGYLLEPFDARADYHGPAYPFSRAKAVDPGHEA